MDRPIARVFDLLDPSSQWITNMSLEEARTRLASGDPEAVLGIEGSFALIARREEKVFLARSLDRPLRYFLAKEKAGPALVVADRIDAIRDQLDALGHVEQFHPSYTRMAPAHHVTTLRLVGCPDPNPLYRRFFSPPLGTLPHDLDEVGAAYVGALRDEIRTWIDALPEREPLGVLFSGGLDSGTVLLCCHDELLAAGQSPARLKAFTLSVGDGGSDLEQARRFVRETDLEMLLEPIVVPADAIDPFAAVEAIEDYKARDVECAAVTLALLREIRRREPSWRFLVDGDGGDENLKDYPIEENPELTIRSVVSNRMLYQEGWGVEAIKHSLTYSGGLSRGCVRGYAPASLLGFEKLSPMTSPRVVAVAEGIPFADLTRGSHERLYALKGEVLRRGVRAVLGRELPVFPKRRFQEGAGELSSCWPTDPEAYRRHYLRSCG